MRPTLKFAQWLLFALSFCLLAYCVVTVVDARVFQTEETNRFEELLAVRTPALSRSPPLAARADGLVGRMEISRLGLSVIVVEGTGPKALRHAAGHISGTALPGEPGNIGISGHRDTFFRPLRNIRSDDLITLTTLSGEYRYRVVSTQVVSPDNVAVLDSDGGEILTVVTCYPFYFVGPAPDRFIVRAERVI